MKFTRNAVGTYAVNTTRGTWTIMKHQSMWSVELNGVYVGVCSATRLAESKKRIARLDAGGAFAGVRLTHS